MFQYALFVSLIAVGQCFPSIIDTGGLTSGSYGAGDFSGGWQGSLNLASGDNNYEGAASSYGGLNLESLKSGGGEGGGSVGGDYHHGVSIVSLDSNQKGTILDLTSHAGEGHKGFFGGSFVSSSKEGGGDSHHGGESSEALSAAYGVLEDFSSDSGHHEGGSSEYKPLASWVSNIGDGQEGLSAYHSDGAVGGSVW